MLNYEYKVAVDLDGVICAFAARIKELTGEDCKSISKGKLWGAVQKYNDAVAPFYESLNKMPDADMLWNFCIQNFAEVFILSASGSTPRDTKQQKINWVTKNLGPNVDIRIVTSAESKAIYANPRTILIDDTPRAINAWEKAGGIGILHTSAKDSIEQLKKILKRQN